MGDSAFPTADPVVISHGMAWRSGRALPWRRCCPCLFPCRSPSYSRAQLSTGRKGGRGQALELLGGVLEGVGWQVEQARLKGAGLGDACWCWCCRSAPVAAISFYVTGRDTARRLGSVPADRHRSSGGGGTGDPALGERVLVLSPRGDAQLEALSSRCIWRFAFASLPSWMPLFPVAISPEIQNRYSTRRLEHRTRP